MTLWREHNLMQSHPSPIQTKLVCAGFVELADNLEPQTNRSTKIVTV